MRLPFLLLVWISVVAPLPLAPPPPDFNADFSEHTVKSDLMAVVDEDELQSLRHNGFQEQLRHLRSKNIGRDPVVVTEEMARVRNSVEDISEFSIDSTEVDQALHDITVPTDTKLSKSSKFAELAQIHNVDSANKNLPPFAFSEDATADAEVEKVEIVQKVEAVPPKTVLLVTMPFTTPASTTRTTASSTTITTSTIPTSTVSVFDIDSDVQIPRRSSGGGGSTRTRITTTTLPTTTTTRYSYPQTTTHYPTRTQSPHIFSSSTVKLPSALPLAPTSGAPRASPIVMTTPRPYRGAPFTTEFTIEPVHRRNKEETGTELRERIRSTSQLLNLLGDRIEGIDQKMMGSGTPKTGVLTNIYDQGVVKRRNYRSKQWGKTGGSREKVQSYDGQFTGLAYGSTKTKGGGYTMRKRMSKKPWGGKGYKTRRLGERRPDNMHPATFLEKKTTDVAVEPYGSKRRGEWIRGVKLSERRKAMRNVSETQRSLAQSLLETEEASMRQLKNTLRQIREVVRFKTTSASSTSTIPPKILQNLQKNEFEKPSDTFFKGQFDWRR